MAASVTRSRAVATFAGASEPEQSCTAATVTLPALIENELSSADRPLSQVTLPPSDLLEDATSRKTLDFDIAISLPN